MTSARLLTSGTVKSKVKSLVKQYDTGMFLASYDHSCCHAGQAGAFSWLVFKAATKPCALVFAACIVFMLQVSFQSWPQTSCSSPKLIQGSSPEPSHFFQLLPIIMICSAFFPKLHPVLAPSICQHQDCSCHCSSPASQKLGSKLRGRIYNGLASFCQLWHSFAQHGEVSEP